jgi:hypothetical protein
LIDWLIDFVRVRDLAVPMHLGLIKGPLCPKSESWEPCSFTKATNGSQNFVLDIPWLQKEGAQMHMSEWGPGLAFTENVGRGLLLYTTSLIHRAFYQPQQEEMPSQDVMPVKKTNYHPGLSPVKGQNLVLLLRLGHEINSLACLRVPLWSLQLAQCCLFNQRPSLFCIFRLETPKTGAGSRKPRPEPSLASPSAISLPCNPACPGTQYSPTTCRAEMSFNALWHWWTKGDVVLTAWSAFSAASLSEHILTYE